jgi:hypothetical protein
MNAPVFILPTSGPATYRGKYPARPRSVSHGETGLHVELNDGTRLWTAKSAELPELKSDCSPMLARALPMTAAQYARLMEAAELLRTRVNFAGRVRRAELTARVRAIVESIQPDDSQYAKRNAEGRRTAWAELERMAALADERNAMAARLARIVAYRDDMPAGAELDGESARQIIAIAADEA